MNKFLIALCLIACLPSCAGKREIVSVPCIDAKDIPPEPASVKPDLTGDAVHDATVLARGLLAWKAYGIRLHALTAGCVG